MDWYVPNEIAAISQLRAEFSEFIDRHAAPGSDLPGAQLIFSELVTNAVENSDQPVWVSLKWGGEQPVLSVNDLGPGFELPDQPARPGADSARGRGLLIVTHLTDHLEVAAKGSGGSRVTVTLPIRRPPSPSFQPKPFSSSQLLPTPDEKNERGQFGRESFLRALVVQLAQSVERDSGPAAAEQLVAELGAGIGFRMEEAFRAKEQQPDAPLSAEKMAELFVHLKHGIDGDFFIIEANEERIILGNRRCPFGDAVRHAPALCRMTSSVFGGIGARNRGAAAVHLEERIAIGDPQCRVTVWLKDPPSEIQPETHFYLPQRPAHT